LYAAPFFWRSATFHVDIALKLLLDMGMAVSSAAGLGLLGFGFANWEGLKFSVAATFVSDSWRRSPQTGRESSMKRKAKHMKAAERG